MIFINSPKSGAAEVAYARTWSFYCIVLHFLPFIVFPERSLSGSNAEGLDRKITLSLLKNWELIGGGSFSNVFLASRRGTKLAIKVLKPSKLNTSHEEDFNAEMKLVR